MGSTHSHREAGHAVGVTIVANAGSGQSLAGLGRRVS